MKSDLFRWISCGFVAAFVVGTGAIAADAPPAFGWTRVNDTDDAVSYSPNVSAGPLPGYFNDDMHSSSSVDGWCQFDFKGTGVKWIGAKNKDHGTAEVYLDGKLDATIDTTSPTWLMQQELYTKTGLHNGPHALKIVIKTPGFQDFDAFEYLTNPPVPIGPKNLGSMILPEQVPYLNTAQRYPLGNGMGMAVGGPLGEWSQLCGPDYTTPNFITSELILLEVDGVEKPLQMEMKRARETGLYYGMASIGDLQVHLMDYGVRGQPMLTRLVMIDNVSKDTAHDVRLRARITARLETGMTHALVEDGDHHRCGATLVAEPKVQVPYAGGGQTNRSVVIAFADPTSTAFVEGDTFTLETKMNRVGPGDSWNMALGNYFRRDKTSDGDAIAAIRSAKSLPDLEKAITDWQGWYRGVPAAYQLSKVTDTRARDLMEGGLAILKTNQSLDGGIIAHSTFYKGGYIRDAELNVRGLMAAGHTEEAKLWLIWLDNVWKTFGHLPDSIGCYAELAKHAGSFDMGTSDTEETAEYVLIARNYYAATKDLDLLKKLRPSLQYCMDVQLRDAVSNNYKLEFNGDETEICGAIDVGPAGTRMNENATKFDWSMSSVAMCAASVDFYMKYLTLLGEDPAKYRNSLTNTTLDLHAELDRLVKAMDTDFWRTDVAEIPDGFHDSFRLKSDNSLPKDRIVNFTVMPIYYGTPYPADEQAKDAAAIAHYFDDKTGFLQLAPGAKTGFEGHDLGYLLWALVETNNPKKDDVYKALVNGPSVDCWGSFNEAYDRDGHRNDHDLRSLETGVNIDALAKYWKLGS